MITAKQFFISAVLCAAMVPLSATAQAGLFEAQAEETGRYTMEPVDGGFLRLDTQTGAVSVCSGSGDAWSCTPAQDERSKLEEENAQLRADNLALREQISELGEKPNVTTPEDVDAAMDAFETVAERFGRIIKIMRREMEELDQDLNAPADQDTDPAN
ncbi:hypothetical protein [Candidatus Phaeomarinobacter ectocarpi]|nr:hypothetical protein [Candidatus Phaeomarinobacter ectocarpi]